MLVNKCPKCGRSLTESADGRIGKCSQHGWFPIAEDAAAEAANRNAEAENKKKQDALQRELEKQREIERLKRQHQAKVLTAIAVSAIIIVGAITLLAVFLFKPMANYKKACVEFESANYESAMTGYNDLGNYKDSKTRVLLCEIMLTVQSGDSESAVAAINELVLKNASAETAFANAVTPVLTDWEAKSISPEFVIAVINKLGNTPLANGLDSLSLWTDAHAALLPDAISFYWQSDLNGDGDPDLVVVREDGTIASYAMTASGNKSISVDNSVIASAAASEAKAVYKSDLVRAVCCMAVSYISSADNESAKQLQTYTSELISSWKSKGIAPDKLLEALGISVMSGAVKADSAFQSVWQEAALECSGKIRQYYFSDRDGNGLEELLIIGEDNCLCLYGFESSWKCLSKLDELPADASFSIVGDSPIVVIKSGANNAFVSAAVAGNKLHVLFQKTDISDYSVNGSVITYSVVLPGSVSRRSTWEYRAESSSDVPVRTGIDWQEANYPMPSSADETMLRYIEARVYNIAEEAKLLSASYANDAALMAVQFPESLDAVSYAPYSCESDTVMYEVSAVIDGRTVTNYFTAEYDGQWKISAVSESFTPEKAADAGDLGVTLICTNEEMTASAEKGYTKTYRVLLPYSIRAALQWGAGSSNSSSTAYKVSIYRDSLTSTPIITYDLKQQSSSRQQTRDMFLAPGVYYISVEAKTDEPYSFTVLASADAYIELEGNDTSREATPAALNQTYYGSLLTSGDVDFYSFTISGSNAVNISLSSSGTGDKNTVFVGAIYNGSSGEKITSFSLAGNIPSVETGNLYLGEGTYIVQIGKGSTWTDEEYSLTVNTQTDIISEAESNNTPATANTVPLNEDIHGSFGVSGDIDCFRCTLDTDAVIQLRFSFAPTESSSKTYVLTVMDSNQRVIETFNIGGKESSKVIPPLALKAGTYIIKAENPKFVKQEYTLFIYSEPARFCESESNNSAAAATVINISTPVTGVLSSDKDEDYYKITFTQDTTVTLSFAFSQSCSRTTVYTVSLEQNGKTAWKQSVSADSGGVEQQMLVPAGEYYIRIKSGSSWVGNIYTLTVK